MGWASLDRSSPLAGPGSGVPTGPPPGVRVGPGRTAPGLVKAEGGPGAGSSGGW